MASTASGVVIVGTGFSGLGMAIRLKRAGINDFTVLERAGEVGGTWRDNTYPGCMCDVPSQLYSFSFALKADWSCTYPSQQEIWTYLRRCAEDFGVLPHIRFHTEVTGADWDESEQRWHVSTSGGEHVARFLVLGVGPLSEPRLPDIPGIRTFKGAMWHSAQWNHEHDLRGERVAVLGTGASAIQFVPQIQPRVAHLDLYQRTAAWVMPHPNRDLTAFEQRAARAFPLLQLVRRAGVYAGRELVVLGLTLDTRIMALGERTARAHLSRQVRDPELRRKLTPNYRLGCKRILLSNDYYPSLTQPNVDVITDSVAEIREHSIVTAAGEERETDTIIFGTGFHVTDLPLAAKVRGRSGASLDDVWQGSPQAYKGTSVSGFPNLFFLTGPNTGLGHTSLVYMIESQIDYVMQCLRAMNAKHAAVIDVTAEAQVAFNDSVQRQMRGTVWVTGGCASWYIDSKGRNTTLWPSFTFDFRRKARRLDPAAYTFEPARTPRPERVAA